MATTALGEGSRLVFPIVGLSRDIRNFVLFRLHIYIFCMFREDRRAKNDGQAL
jgi:hypothetical protein